MCKKELLQRAMPKDVEIDVEEQINVAEADTQLCENININSKYLSIISLDAKAVKAVFIIFVLQQVFYWKIV